VASTRSRARGREHARPSAGGVAAEHATKIYTVAIVGIIVIIAFLTLTHVGHVIDAATQHFMLFYAGVFALIGLCASVGLGLVATDRMFMNPGHRVMIQSAHRAASFGAVAFLIIHITTEILAQRVHVIDAVVPFLSPFRTFYIGLGTISSDLIILLVITGIMRGRFNANAKAWRWRAIHYTSYVAFVFGVWHGLLGGRPGKPYVDWSYGFVVAFVLLGLAVRVLSNSLRPKENLSAPPVHESANSASAPLRAAAMFAQMGASRGGYNGLGAGTGGQPVLSAPVTAQVLTALPAGSSEMSPGQPYYEPGYEGPARYLGAPRATGTGPLPRASGPMPRARTGPMPVANTGPLPPYVSGPMPRAGTSPMPAANTGPLPPYVSGPMPRMGSGPMPLVDTGSLPPYVSGPMPVADTGPLPPYVSGPMPRMGSGPMPVAPLPPYASGPMPRATGPFPRATGPFPSADTGPRSWPGTGPIPRGASGPMPPAGDGRQPVWETSPQPRAAGGHVPRAASGPRPRGGTGPMAPGNGRGSRPDTRQMPPADGPTPPYGVPGVGGGQPGRSGGWPGAGYGGVRRPVEPPWDGGLPEADPDLRYREPGPGMPGYRGSRDHRYGGDVR